MRINQKTLVKKWMISIVTTAVLVAPGGVVDAQTPSSSSYSVPESSFVGGSSLDSTSASYSGRVSIGDLGTGTADSTNYNARPGFVTPDEEFLDFVVQTSTVALGTLSTTTTGSGTGQFYVRAYINGSYFVQTMSQPPTSEGGAILAPLGGGGVSTQGTEQFGINLVANTTPAIGADPVLDPSATYANGEAATNYDTADTYTYNVIDTIAQSGASGPAWGRTDFTISYIANMSSITEAGTYIMEHDLVVTVTY